MNRSGQAVDMSYVLVRIVLAVLVFIFAVWLGFKLVGLFGTGGDELDASKQNFIYLDTAINRILKSPSDVAGVNIEYYIAEGFWLIGFDAGEPSNPNPESIDIWTQKKSTVCPDGDVLMFANGESPDQLTRDQHKLGGCVALPTACAKLPCLCLYKDVPKESKPNDNIVTCKSDYPSGMRLASDMRFQYQSNDWYDRNGIIAMPRDDLPSLASQQEKDRYLVITGGARTVYSIYLEKTPRAGTVTITLTDKPSTEREYLARKTYTVCPAGSNDACAHNEPYDTIIQTELCPDNDNQARCAYDFTSQVCVVDCMDWCPFRIVSACICGNDKGAPRIYDKGFCGTSSDPGANRGLRPHFDYVLNDGTNTVSGQCIDIQVCSDYDKQTSANQYLCEQDPCHIGCKPKTNKDTYESCEPSI
ncbi:MAG: hypothetical protein ABIA93_02820 [Candidatus Woesearchaeota archaeon]